MLISISTFAVDLESGNDKKSTFFGVNLNETPKLSTPNNYANLQLSATNEGLAEGEKYNRFLVGGSGSASNAFGSEDMEGMLHLAFQYHVFPERGGLHWTYEALYSMNDYQADNFDDYINKYRDDFLAAGLGAEWANEKGILRLFLRATGGVGFYFGTLSVRDYTTSYGTEETEFSDFVFYYNVGAGLDLLFTDRFGISMFAGLSNISSITFGITYAI